MNEDHRPSPTQGNSVSGKEINHQNLPREHKFYQIRVEGHLNKSWSEWFDGLVITHELDGTSVLSGLLVDQPALHGLLLKIRDLGLSLISVCHVKSDSEDALSK